MIEINDPSRPTIQSEALIPQQPQDSDSLVPDQDQIATINRRTFLKASVFTAGLLFGAGTIRGLDKIINDTWPYDQPSLNFYNPLDATIQHDEIAILFPGYGEMSVRGKAYTLRQKGNLPPDVPVAYIDYSNEGVTAAKMARVIRETIEPLSVKRLRLVGHSFGGPFSLVVASELGLPVSSATLISSPFSMANAHYGGLGKFVSKAPNLKEADLVIKFLVNMNDQDEAHGYEHLFSNIGRARKSTLLGGSGQALESEAQDLDEINLRSAALQARLGKVLLAGKTRVAYSSTNKPETDHTVDVLTSPRLYAWLFNLLDVSFENIPGNYAGHSNIEGSLVALHNWAEVTNHTDKSQYDTAA